MSTEIKPIPWTAGHVAEATGGTVVCQDPGMVFLSVSIDSRNIGPDALFVAIQGERHDGHAFIEEMVDKGVRGFVIQEALLSSFPVTAWEKSGISCIAVGDTTRALADMASFQKKRSGVKLVAITGSCGKTTTRAMTASIFGRHFKTLSTKGNFNNEIGLPLTLLQLGSEHEWAVVELGMNSPGEIARLGAICRPDIGVITNVGKAHLEGLGSIENIALAKGELLETITADGAAVLNGEDRLVAGLALPGTIRPFFFGFSENFDARAESVTMTDQGVDFTLMLDNDPFKVHIVTPGMFMVANALAAASAAHLAGLSAENIAEGLRAFTPVSGRMNIEKTDRGFFVIDDTYNANPTSMAAAIETVNGLKGGHRSLVVTGDMLELGEGSDLLHEEMGHRAATAGTDLIFITGGYSDAVARGALDAGMTPEAVFTGSKDEILAHLKQRLKAGDWVLVKGSRGMAMEEIVGALKLMAVTCN